MENNPSFEEEHTGLEDVLIEIKIYNRVMRQKKKMTKGIVNDNRNFDFSHLTFNDFNFRSNTEVS